MEQMQCPLCKDRITAPIIFCEKRHNVFFTCRESLDECPNCSQQFSGIRNINLEKISSWSNFSCPHLEKGCSVMDLVGLMADYLANWVYKKATCPLNKTMLIVCPWEGLLKDVVFHCKESYRNHFAECEFFMSSSTENAVNVMLYDMKYSFSTNDSWPVNFAVLSRKWALLRDGIEAASFWTR
jgi:hypothetical protein